MKADSSMWDLTLLIVGSILCFTFHSQPRYLGGLLVLTAILGISLAEFRPPFILWCIGTFTYFFLHIVAVALSPLQILWVKSKPSPETPWGLTILYPPADIKERILVDIVAVHGLGSNPDWAWQHEKTRAIWLRDFLPKDFPQARIMTFNHNSAWSTNAPVKTTEVCGIELLHVLNTKRETEEEKKRPIIFIGHSFGGIIIKKALVIAGRENTDSRHQSIKNSMFGAIFLGVPHDGSRLTTVGKLMSYTTYWLGSNTELLEALQLGNESLRELNAAFLEGYGNHDIINFYELHMTGIGRFPCLIAVDRDSSSFAGKANVPLDADHVGMNKYPNQEDQNYKLVAQEIKNMTEKIQGAYGNDSPVVDPDFKDCLKSLDYEGSGTRKAAIETPHRPTLGWVNEDPFMSGWLESKRDFVWVRGKAGSGKSTLSKHILERLKRLKQGSDTAVIGFFFSDRGSDLDKSEKGCLRSLGHQLLQQIPALSDHILPQYRLMNDQHATVSWANEDVKKMLILMIGDPRASSIRIVLDALDECQDDSTFSLLAFIHDELSRLERPPQIFITSRPDERFNNYAKSFSLITLEQKNGPDIRSYVNSKVKSLDLGHIATEDVDKLATSIIRRAQGVFLWAKLVLTELRDVAPGSSFLELNQVLEDIPEDLKGVYARILDKLEKQIKDRDLEETKKILQWALLAKRPLTLSDLRYALAIGSSTEYASLASIQNCSLGSIPKLSQMEARITRLCGGLVEVMRVGHLGKVYSGDDRENPENMTIQLIHQSVKDFLLSNQNNSKLSIQLRRAQRYLARVCITTLTFPDSNVSAGPRAHATVEPKISFEDYAAQYWLHHASEADVEGERQLAAFDWPKSTKFNEWATFYKSVNVRYPRPKWINWGKTNSFSDDLRHLGDERLYWSGIQWTLPLAICLRWELHSDTEYLLSNILASKLSEIDATRGLTEALLFAIERGHEEAARQLIMHGADVNLRFNLDTDWRQLGLVSILMREKELQLTLLLIATLSNQRVMIRLLIENGAEIHQPQNDVLLLAVHIKNLELVEYLLESGADCNKHGTLSQLQRTGPFQPQETPLYAAAVRGFTEIMQRLIDFGAKVNVVSGHHGTALQAAIFNGQTKAAQLLLDAGAENVIGVGVCGSAVQAAAFSGNSKILRQLLDPLNVADVNSLHGCYGHALHAAAFNGHIECMREIMNKGGFGVILWNRYGNFYMNKRHMRYFDRKSWMGHTWETKPINKMWEGDCPSRDLQESVLEAFDDERGDSFLSLLVHLSKQYSYYMSPLRSPDQNTIEGLIFNESSKDFQSPYIIPSLRGYRRRDYRSPLNLCYRFDRAKLLKGSTEMYWNWSTVHRPISTTSQLSESDANFDFTIGSEDIPIRSEDTNRHLVVRRAPRPSRLADIKIVNFWKVDSYLVPNGNTKKIQID